MNFTGKSATFSMAALGAIVLGGLPCTWAQEADYALYDQIKSQRPIIGPLVGHVTDATASIWAYAGPRTSPVVLEIAELETNGDPSDDEVPPVRLRLDATPDPARHHAVQFQVTGLKPETKYAFAVRLAENDDAVEPGVFTTAPARGAGSEFRVAVASCFGGAYQRENGKTAEKRGEYHNDSWRLLMDSRPDMQLIIGDNVYADSTDYNHLWDSHVLERTNNQPFAASIRTIPTYAVWDDHDYGPNNSDGTAKGKERSLRAFHELYANPPRQGSEAPGIFTKFDWGGVDFFLLDGRYHRTPNDAPNGEAKTFLGPEQLEWLIGELKASEAPFKVLVCGSTWEASRSDGWRIFRFARRQLWNAIVEHKIDGVVYVSGDVHWCDIRMHRPEVEGAYPFPEIISSGLGSHGKHDPMGFAVMDFDTTGDDPMMTARVFDGTGLETVTRQVRASELKVRN